MADDPIVLAAEGLKVRFGADVAVDGASLELRRGEIVGLTGASGAGKSTLALALLGLVRPPGVIAGGAVHLAGRDLLALPASEAAALRGLVIALIVQNPRAALHPMLPVGRQIGRIRAAHHGEADPAHAVEMLRLVGINDPERRVDSFAHELSGGMAQRVLIAAALSADPQVLIADEPTSGLDVTVQAQFLDMMATAAKARGTAMLLVSQEPGVLANYCDRVLTMAGGRIVADKPIKAHFAGHRAAEPVPPRATADSSPLLAVSGLVKRFPLRGSTKQVHAVEDVGFTIGSGETLGLVGESGSGKTTVGRCLVRLTEPDAGQISFAGGDLTHLSGSGLRALRREVQMVRQDPFDNFDPRWTIGRSLRQPLDVHEPGATDADQRVAAMIERVGCAPDVARQRPRDLAAGTLQRLAVARALMTRPRFVVLDEPTSVLPPPARLVLVDLLKALQQEMGVAYLMISHDLTTIAALSHRVAVMYLGRIVELGSAAEVFERPAHPYTRALIAAHLAEDPARRRLDHPPSERLEGEIPSPVDLPQGCALASRCSHVRPRCRQEPQALIAQGERWVRCWRAGDIA